MHEVRTCLAEGQEEEQSGCMLTGMVPAVTYCVFLVFPCIKGGRGSLRESGIICIPYAALNNALILVNLLFWHHTIHVSHTEVAFR